MGLCKCLGGGSHLFVVDKSPPQVTGHSLSDMSERTERRHFQCGIGLRPSDVRISSLKEKGDRQREIVGAMEG